jgi:hypothetical protein
MLVSKEAAAVAAAERERERERERGGGRGRERERERWDVRNEDWLGRREVVVDANAASHWY